MKIAIYKPTKDKIFSTTPEIAGFNFNRKKCILLIRNIQKMYNLNKGKCEDEFIQLCAVFLQNIAHDYPKYLNWMESNKIIQINRQYNVGSFCRGYKLLYPYNKELTNNRNRFEQIFIKEKRKHPKKKDNLRGISFLKKNLQKITIDEIKAFDISETIFQNDIRNPRQRMKKGKYKNQLVDIDPIRALENRKNSILSIASRDFYITRDNTSGRIHTNLTSLNSNLFCCIKYNNKPLIGYDIANCQPFLTSILIKLILTPLIQNNSTNKINYTHKNSKPTNTNQINSLLNYINSYTNHSFNPKQITIMLEKNFESIDFQKVEEFENLCSTGQLYQTLSPILFNVNYTGENKRQIKDFFFTLFFTKPRNLKNGIKKFKAEYPDVHNIISLIKIQSNNENFFPVILQCMESYFIIERISKNFNKTYPNAPIFTKHDSIYTVTEYKTQLLQIIEEESKLLFNCIPTIREC